jgi:hypothetical protein
VVNMLRQVGFAVGVATLVAVLGTPHGADAQLLAFRHAWYVTAGAGLAAALAAALLRRRPAGQESGGPATAQQALPRQPAPRSG